MGNTGVVDQNVMAPISRSMASMCQAAPAVSFTSNACTDTGSPRAANVAATRSHSGAVTAVQDHVCTSAGERLPRVRGLCLRRTSDEGAFARKIKEWMRGHGGLSGATAANLLALLAIVARRWRQRGETTIGAVTASPSTAK